MCGITLHKTFLSSLLLQSELVFVVYILVYLYVYTVTLIEGGRYYKIQEGMFLLHQLVTKRRFLHTSENFNDCLTCRCRYSGLVAWKCFAPCLVQLYMDIKSLDFLWICVTSKNDHTSDFLTCSAKTG